MSDYTKDDFRNGVLEKLREHGIDEIPPEYEELIDEWGEDAEGAVNELSEKWESDVQEKKRSRDLWD